MISPDSDMYTLRPATSADATFLYDLHVAAMRDVVAATWGWDESCQQQRFASRFAPETIQIVEVSGEPVGMLEVEKSPTEYFLANVKLLPRVQGLGLGTAVLRDLLAVAAEENRAVRLQVLEANVRARRLYERLGFVVAAEISPHIQMVWEAPATTNADGRR